MRQALNAPRPREPERTDRRADYLSREEALEILHIKRQTLYCYVSRGYIRSVPRPDGHASYYLREDVERVRAKSAARAGHGPAAAGAMRWGEPVMQTALTGIGAAGPRYRDRLALDLAREGCPFEQVAEYLWTGDWSAEAPDWRTARAPDEIPDLLAATVRLYPRVQILKLLAQTTLSLGIAEECGGQTASTCATVVSARRLIRTMTGVFGFLGPDGQYVELEHGEPMAHGLARALGLAREARIVAALDAVLVLAADHELNPATFAARIAASGGAGLHAGVVAALEVHSGIARTCERVEQLFAAPSEPAAVLAAIRSSLDGVHKLTGLNHPLYPHGDPRTQMMIDLAREIGGGRELIRNMLESQRRMRERFQMLPGIEVGLVTICRALGLRDRTAGGLFALARSAGWVAHIIEQRSAGFMIRPRAKFSGASAAN